MTRTDFWFWPSVAVMKKLFDEILENIGIGSALKYTAQEHLGQVVPFFYHAVYSAKLPPF
jgi:hypothetical protein